MREAVQHRETYAGELWKRDTRLVLWALVLAGAAAFLLGALGSQPGRAWQGTLSCINAGEPSFAGRLPICLLHLAL